MRRSEAEESALVTARIADLGIAATGVRRRKCSKNAATVGQGPRGMRGCGGMSVANFGLVTYHCWVYLSQWRNLFVFIREDS